MSPESLGTYYESLLEAEGLMCFVTSNKWMRAGYGESLRKFLQAKDYVGTDALVYDLYGLTDEKIAVIVGT